MPRFRFNNKRAFLTYSQVGDNDGTALAEHLFRELSNDPLWLELSSELHEDGGLHFHVVLVWEQPFRGNEQSFDWNGLHPNIKPILGGERGLERVRKYIRKDLTENPDALFIVRGDAPPYVTSAERITWGHVLEENHTAADFLQAVRHAFPKEYVLRHNDLLSFAQIHFNAPDEYVPRWPRDAYTVPQELDDWVAEVFEQVNSYIPPRLRLDT